MEYLFRKRKIDYSASELCFTTIDFATITFSYLRIDSKSFREHNYIDHLTFVSDLNLSDNVPNMNNGAR